MNTGPARVQSHGSPPVTPPLGVKHDPIDIMSPHMSVTIDSPSGAHTGSNSTDIRFVVTDNGEEITDESMDVMYEGTTEDDDGQGGPEDMASPGTPNHPNDGDSYAAQVHAQWRLRAPDEYPIALAPALMVKRIAVRERLPGVSGSGPSHAPAFADVVENNETIVHDERLVCSHCHYLLDSPEALDDHYLGHHRQQHHHAHRHVDEADEAHGRVPRPPVDLAMQPRRQQGYIESARAAEHKRVWRGSVFNREAHDRLPGYRTMRMLEQRGGNMSTTATSALPTDDTGGAHEDDVVDMIDIIDRPELEHAKALAREAGVKVTQSFKANTQRYQQQFIAAHFAEQARSIRAQPPPSHIVQKQENEVRPDSPWLFEPDVFLLRGIGGDTHDPDQLSTLPSTVDLGASTKSLLAHQPDPSGFTDPIYMCQFMVLKEPGELEVEGDDMEDKVTESESTDEVDEDDDGDNVQDQHATTGEDGPRHEVPVVQFPSATWEEDKDAALMRITEPVLDDYIIQRPTVTGVTIQETDDRRVIVDSQEEENIRILREIRAQRARKDGPVNNTTLFYNNKRRRNYMTDTVNDARYDDFEEANFQYTDLKRRSHAVKGSRGETTFSRYEQQMYELDDQLFMKSNTLGGHTFTKYKPSGRGTKDGDTVAANKNTQRVYNPEEGISRAAVAAAIPTIGHGRARGVAFMDKETQRLLAKEHQVITVRAQAMHATGAMGAMVQGSIRPTVVPAPDEIYLFCYGRHMDHRLVEQQVGHRVDPPVFGLVFEYLFKFNKKGMHAAAGSFENVEKRAGTSCEGVIYRLHPNDITALDDYMAAPKHYERTNAVAWMSRSPSDPILCDTVRVTMYKATSDWTDRNDQVAPSRTYVKEIIKYATLLSPAAILRIEEASMVRPYRQRSRALPGNKAPRAIRFKQKSTLLSPASKKEVTVVTLGLPAQS